ncbi:unnamed protein product [Discosporangium mesarthrocarpum]
MGGEAAPGTPYPVHHPPHNYYGAMPGGMMTWGWMQQPPTAPGTTTAAVGPYYGNLGPTGQIPMESVGMVGEGVPGAIAASAAGSGAIVNSAASVGAQQQAPSFTAGAGAGMHHRKGSSNGNSNAEEESGLADAFSSMGLAAVGSPAPTPPAFIQPTVSHACMGRIGWSMGRGFCIPLVLCCDVLFSSVCICAFFFLGHQRCRGGLRVCWLTSGYLALLPNKVLWPTFAPRSILSDKGQQAETLTSAASSKWC